MAAFRTLDDLPPDCRVLVRLDLNSPVDEGVVKDNHRIRRHAETVRELAEAGHRVACLAHQGRPGRDDFVSLEQHADLLSDHIGRDVQFVPDTYGERAVTAIRKLNGGDVLLLENTRMTDAELPERDPTAHAASDFVRSLADVVDVYVNDAYSAAHRSHASLVGFPLVLPAYAGRVMAAEYEANTAIASRSFDGPVTMVLGGVKATDVIEVMDALEGRVDRFLLGGVTGELFLRADGAPIGRDVGGSDLFDDQWDRNADEIAELLDRQSEDIRLPVDLAYLDNEGTRSEIAVKEIERKTTAYRDVGSETLASYRPTIKESAAVFVKGAVGVFEDERFKKGTVGILETIADSNCFSVVGGGDTSRAIELYGLDPSSFSHVSIAGGAYIRALTGKPLPAVELLERSAAGEFSTS